MSKPGKKIGVEEFLAVARRFGFSEGALARIASAVTDDDLMGSGPNLARFVCAFPADPAGPRFEAAAREKFGKRFAMGVSSGTAALHSAFVGVGVGPGTEVIVPAIGFMATSAAVALAGGTPVFCDVDESLHMDAARMEALITDRTVAAAPTHVMGSICDLDPIVAVARKHGLRVIEDCAQSPGGRYRGQYVGTVGDAGIFSISAYKIIGGGEGGLVITDDEALYERAWQLAECGGLWRPDRFAPPRHACELFVGTNYRMSELEAAIDIVQLGKLDEVVRRHHAVKMRLLGRLERFVEIQPQKLNDRDGEIGYLLRFFPRTPELSARVAGALRAQGIEAATRGKDPRPDWHIYRYMFPVAESVDAARSHCLPGDCPVADDLWEREVTVSLDQWAAPDEVDGLADRMNRALGSVCTPAGAMGWL